MANAAGGEFLTSSQTNSTFPSKSDAAIVGSEASSAIFGSRSGHDRRVASPRWQATSRKGHRDGMLLKAVCHLNTVAALVAQ